MPIRAVPPRSERGSIKDIQKTVSDHLEEDPNMPATPQELRIKSLYEHALVLRDQALIDSLGLIVMDGSAKDPVSIMRHRQYVQELSAKLGTQVAETKQDIEILVEEAKEKPYEMRVAAYKQAEARNLILSQDGAIIKNASDGSTRRACAFWRAK
jgi:hypothetical protein